MGRSTSEGNMQGTMTVEGSMEGDTAKDKMGTNTSKGNLHGMGNKQMHDPVSRNCAIFVVTVKLHIITSTQLYCQGIAPGSQYSDPVPEATTLHWFAPMGVHKAPSQ